MPSSAPRRAADIAALDDEALDRHLEESRMPDGTRAVLVDDWENLPGQFLQRLRDRALDSGAATVAIDPDELSRRLLQIPPDRQPPSPGSPPFQRSPTEPSRGPIFYETLNYHELVALGGRPLYPIHLIGDVSQHPEDYLDMLRPWLECPNSKYPPDWTEIFGMQLDRWQDFRRWQLDNRDLADENDGFSGYVKMLAHRYERDEEKHMLAELRADPESVREVWRRVQGKRDRKRRTEREIRGRGSFPEYAEAAKRRLARHGFTGPFQLLANPSQQDRLTTWIEYIEFECWWHDRHVRSFERQQSKSDAAWAKLLKSGVLRPSETAEYLRGDEGRMARERQKQHAQQALKNAKAMAEDTPKPTRKVRGDPSEPDAPSDKPSSRAQRKLEAATKAFQTVWNRNERISDFIGETRAYVEFKRRVECHGNLVRWAMAQVPLMEAGRAADDASRKRGRQEAGEEKGRRKRQRTGASEEEQLSATPPLARETRKQTKTSIRKGSDDAAVPGKATAPRRSAHIAARGQGVAPRRSARIANLAARGRGDSSAGGERLTKEPRPRVSGGRKSKSKRKSLHRHVGRGESGRRVGVK